MMSNMGVYLYNPSNAVTNQMLNSGLEKSGQGIAQQLIPTPRNFKRGLGHF